MGQGIWIDSDKLNKDDGIREVLKHGTLSIGFIGLAECLKALTGFHHGESQESQKNRFRNHRIYEKSHGRYKQSI